jgi:hypothetical protein
MITDANTGVLLTNIVPERPLHLAVCVLVLSGSLWYALGTWSPPKLRLGEPDLDSLRSQSKRKRDIIQRSATSNFCQALHSRIQAFGTPKTSFAILAAAIVLRVILTRSIIRDVECSWNGVNVERHVSEAKWELG